MSDENRDRDEQQDEQTERPRPKVVDKRISARGATGTPAPETRAARPSPDTIPDTGPAETGAATGAGDVGARPSEVWTPEQEADAMRMAREIAQTPSIEWVVNTAATLANVAQTKLELGAAPDAQLAIDALRALLDGLGSKLQAAEAPLRQTLAQLQLGYANAVSAGPARDRKP